MENDYVEEWVNSIEANDKARRNIEEKIGSEGLNKDLENILCHYARVYAQKGLIINESVFLDEIRKHVAGIKPSFVDSQEYAQYEESFAELNYQTRKKDYFNYKMFPDEKMEKMRQKHIEYYDHLIVNLDLYRYNDKLKTDGLEMDFDDLVQRNNTFIRSRDHIPYDHDYDIACTYYENTCNRSEKVSAKMYEVILERLKDTKAKLEKMSVEEYRKFKISQIKLTAMELEKIQKYSEEEKEIPIEKIEFIEEKEPETTTLSVRDYLIEKMNTENIVLPQKFQDTVLKFLDNMFVFDMSKTTYIPGIKTKDANRIFALDGIKGSMRFPIEEKEMLGEIEYAIIKETQDIYKMELNCGQDMMINFTYNDNVPQRGIIADVQRCSYQDNDPKHGMNGLMYMAQALDDGRIVARGNTVSMPSIYDEEGKERKVEKEITSEFKCASYEELSQITNDALNKKQEHNQTKEYGSGKTLKKDL